MFDEMNPKHFSAKQKVWKPLLDFNYCWISFTETGEHYTAFSNGVQLPNKFQIENLSILFRSSSHISKVTHKLIQHETGFLPFPSKTVRIPGCFTAAQKEIALKYVDKIDELQFTRQNDLLEDNFSDRLIVILTKQEMREDFDLEQLKNIWNATEVVVHTKKENVEDISGSEFQSVLFIFEGSLSDFKKTITTVASRAQYEVGVIILNVSQSDFESFNEGILSYLSADTSDFVVLLDQMMTDPPTNNGWLQPRDKDLGRWWNWWNIRMRKKMSTDRENTIEHVKRQSVGVRLQLVHAFSSLFLHPLDQLTPSSAASTGEQLLSFSNFPSYSYKYLKNGFPALYHKRV